MSTLKGSRTTSPRVGVLDIQGSVEEHCVMLKKIGLTPVSVKKGEDLQNLAGLIIPGGESTTISKLLKRYALDKKIKKMARVKRRPLVIWGTCAGAILLAKKVINRPPVSLKLMDMEVVRNAYGRQIDSFRTELSIPAFGRKKIPAVFIRAPMVKTLSAKVKIMAQCNGSPVVVRQCNLFATMFHPELTTDTRIHRYFISLVKHYAYKKN